MHKEEGVSPRQSKLSPERRELLTRLIQKQGVTTSLLPITPQKRATTRMLLSFAQQRLWFLDQLEPGSSYYNIFDTLSFNEVLNVRALEESLNEIVRRHEVLRTTFRIVDGQPQQIIAPDLKLPLQVLDLSHLSPLEREIEASRLSSEEYERPFDLSSGPLVRAKLLQLDAEENLLLLTMHHIISDGWSLNVLSRELRTLYAAFSEGKPSPLPELPIQYADFAVWQREWLQGEMLAGQLDYWEKQLAGAPSVMKLPTDRARPSVQNFQQGANQWLKLPKPLAESLRALSQREGVTLFMTLLSAFDVLLHRYTHQSDIVLGTPIAGRNRAETETLIGFFVNTLVMRTDLSGDPSFRELVGRVKEMALGAYAHQDLPFEKLVEAISPERSLSHHPIFQVMFQLISAQSPNEEREDFDEESSGAEEFEVVEGTAKFDIGLDVFESNGSLTAAVEYSTDLFDHTTIRRMLLHFRNLLESIVASPDTQISKLSFLTAAEREQILWQWNSTRSEYAEESCVHHLFESQVERTPDSIAVVSEGEQLTYAELNERANRLAHYLRGCGVKPEVLVGISMERSVEMIVGLLGILKAGGAYVPLDPAYPKQRLALMLEDARASVLLTQERLLSSLPEHSARIVCLDRDWEQIKLESETNLPDDAQPLNLAYVIYTSGSTGTPKGVMIQHRSLMNWTTRAQVEYALRPDDRILQFSSISFDTAAEEIFPCLTLGATLVLRSDAMASSIAKLLEKCREWKITVLDLPTASWHELTWELATQNLRVPPFVRLVITGGEKALPERLSMWHRSVRGDVRLMQGYGPTEVTVVATIADLSKHRTALTALKEVPIGRPIGNAQAFILDEYGQPVPIGVSGELYIGGDGLARGYLNSASLTAERFIPNPFSQSAGARLYRTGDIARYLADGEIEFLGRVDEQVKIRGYRIELGEIEALLREFREVRDAVVLAREDIPDDRRLVAYLVADQSKGFSVSELRRSLSDALPDYMVPSSFVLLEELPLTPNGKVNRRALPEPSHLHQESAALYVPPRTEMERIIAAIWQEVFHAEKLSVHSNFFDLGGHSLTLVRVHSMLHERLHKEISMLDMFRYPTISSLSDYLSRQQVIRTEVETPRYQQIYDRAEKQKDALSPRKQAVGQMRYQQIYQQPRYQQIYFRPEKQKRALSREPHTKDKVESEFVFTVSVDLTPKYLETHINPYLNAISDIQHVIDEVCGRQPCAIRIQSIKQSSPISVNLNGTQEAIQLIKDTIVPWRRKHIEKMAHLLEKEKQAEIGSKKADILEKRAHAAKDQAEAEKIRAEAERQHEETEKMRLENEKLRLELHQAKIQLALEVLAQIAPNLSEIEKITFIVKLLPPLDILAFSELEIATDR